MSRNIQQSLEFIVCDVVGVDGAAGDSIYIFYTGVMTCLRVLVHVGEVVHVAVTQEGVGTDVEVGRSVE